MKVFLALILLSSLGMTQLASGEAVNPQSKLLQSLQRNWITPAWIQPGAAGAQNNSGSSDSSDSSVSTTDMSATNTRGTKSTNRNSGRQLVMDDNAKKGTEGGNSGSPSGDRGGAMPNPPAGSGSGTIAFDKWYPLCIFIDPSEPDGNALVKDQVDIAAKCGVNLAVWPITIKSDYSNDPNEINSRQQASCNLGKILGVKQWSTQVAGKWPDSPARMCKAWKPPPSPPQTPNLAVAGCAQLCSNSGLGSGYMNSTGKGAYGSGMATGGAVPSILKPGVGGGVGSHEDIGHSEMCMPNYDKLQGQEDLGLGIGTNPTSTAQLDRIINTLYAFAGISRPIPAPEVSAAEGADASGSYTAQGCGIFRNHAYKNDGTWRYDPTQKYYYVPELDPQKQWELGTPLFKPPGAPPKDPPPPFISDPRGDPKDLIFNDTIKLGSDATNPPPGDDPKHRLQRSSDSDNRDALVDSISRRLKDAPDPAGSERSGVSSGGASGNNDPSSLVFDDNVKKGGDSEDKTGAGPSSSSTSSVSSGGSGANDSSQLVFDDNAAKGSEGGGGSSNGSEGGSRAPASQSGGAAAQGLNDGFSSAVNADAIMPKASENPTNMNDDFFQNNPDKANEKKGGRVRGSGLRRAPDSPPNREPSTPAPNH